jgi:hypothetical protein
VLQDAINNINFAVSYEINQMRRFSLISGIDSERSEDCVRDCYGPLAGS